MLCRCPKFKSMNISVVKYMNTHTKWDKERFVSSSNVCTSKI